MAIMVKSQKKAVKKVPKKVSKKVTKKVTKKTSPKTTSRSSPQVEKGNNVGMFITIALLFIIIFSLLLGVKSLVSFETVDTTQSINETMNESLIIQDTLELQRGELVSVSVSVYNTANTPAQNVQFSLSDCTTNISLTSEMIDVIIPRESEVSTVVFQTSANVGEYTCLFEAKKDPFATTIVSQNITLKITE